MGPVKDQIRIMIVDDHAILREGLRMFIENSPNMKVVGNAANRMEALATAKRERPNVVLLDVDLGEENGLAFLTELLEIDENMQVLILTGVRDSEMHRRAVRLGAVGVVMKENAPEVLIKAIEKVRQGEIWLDHSAIASVIGDLRRASPPQRADPEEAKINTLTPREREIVRLTADGLSGPDLAKRLFISEKTVHNHLASIYSKLEVSGRLALALYAQRHGLGSSEEAKK
jgi:two-component system nitrate/nitrite response regulator NarL